MTLFQSFAQLPLWYWLCIFLILGSIVGSFLNVVIYRLPQGLNVVTPKSRCPECEHALAWYDNVPVLGWLWLRGKCRYCKTPISVQYPLVEAVTALMFAGLFVVYYMTSLRPQFSIQGFNLTWAVFLVHLVLLSALLASTMIDARLYIIPPSITWVVTLVALIILPLAMQQQWINLVLGLTPLAPPRGTTAAGGGLIGLILSLILLRLKVLPMSFADHDEVYAAHQKEHEDKEEEPWFHYPHPRREVLKELAFILPPTIGVILGAYLGPRGPVDWPWWLFVLGGVVLGYLVGAGMVWITRILGTLAFGKEAMGLGDVHLLAAIGAVLGPGEMLPVFFIAPFFGLSAAILMFGLGALFKKRFQPIPYGPYLAGAAVIVMIWREPIMAFEPVKMILKNFDILFLV